MPRYDIASLNIGNITPGTVPDAEHIEKFDEIYNWLEYITPIGIDVNCIINEYEHYDMLLENKLGIEYPNMNWPDYWEIIQVYICPSLGVSYDSRKKKMAEKIQKRENDAAVAEVVGKERLAAKIISRKIRPLNWKKIIKTVQIGECALEFTCAMNHFLATRSRNLGLDGLEWKWISFCSDGRPLISVDEVKERLRDKRNMNSRNPSDRRKANNNFTLAMFSEGDDYASKYSGTRRAKKYIGDHVKDITGSEVAMVKIECADIEENLIITSSSRSKTPSFIRELFTEIKLKSCDSDYVFVLGATSHKLVLRSIVGMHKHSNIIANIPLKLTAEWIRVIHILADSFVTCELYHPYAGGSLYICAMDFKKNITSAGEKNILSYVLSEGGSNCGMLHDDEFTSRMLSCYEKIIHSESRMINSVERISEYKEIMPEYKEAKKTTWKDEFGPATLMSNKRIVL